MEKYLIAAAICALSSAAVAQQYQPQPAPPPTPSVTFTGQELDDIFTRLNSPTLYQKNQQGDFTRVIDPNVHEVMQILVTRVNEARRKIATDEKKANDEADAKAKTDAEAKAKDAADKKASSPESAKP